MERELKRRGERSGERASFCTVQLESGDGGLARARALPDPPDPPDVGEAAKLGGADRRTEIIY